MYVSTPVPKMSYNNLEKERKSLRVENSKNWKKQETFAVLPLNVPKGIFFNKRTKLKPKKYGLLKLIADHPMSIKKMFEEK